MLVEAEAHEERLVLGLRPPWSLGRAVMLPAVVVRVLVSWPLVETWLFVNAAVLRLTCQPVPPRPTLSVAAALPRWRIHQ